MELINQILLDLEQKIAHEHAQRMGDEFRTISKTKITILGQFSLLANPKVSALLTLTATVDVDALIQGDWKIIASFKEILTKYGLHYDEDSALIWIPEGSKFDIIYDSPTLICEVIDPMHAILSKAIKARERNKILVRDAIAVFGKPLVELIKKFGGDPEFFLK